MIIDLKWCLCPTDDCWLISSWLTVGANALHCSPYMQVQFNSLSNSAESFKFISYMTFLFRVIKNCRSALSEQMYVGLRVHTGKPSENLDKQTWLPLFHRPLLSPVCVQLCKNCTEHLLTSPAIHCMSIEINPSGCKSRWAERGNKCAKCKLHSTCPMRFLSKLIKGVDGAESNALAWWFVTNSFGLFLLLS